MSFFLSFFQTNSSENAASSTVLLSCNSFGLRSDQPPGLGGDAVPRRRDPLQGHAHHRCLPGSRHLRLQLPARGEGKGELA